MESLRLGSTLCPATEIGLPLPKCRRTAPTDQRCRGWRSSVPSQDSRLGFHYVNITISGDCTKGDVPIMLTGFEPLA